jgi:hypothetical protein
MRAFLIFIHQVVNLRRRWGPDMSAIRDSHFRIVSQNCERLTSSLVVLIMLSTPYPAQLKVTRNSEKSELSPRFMVACDRVSPLCRRCFLGIAKIEMVKVGTGGCDKSDFPVLLVGWGIFRLLSRVIRRPRLTRPFPGRPADRSPLAS